MDDNEYKLACSIRDSLIENGTIDKWEGDVLEILQRPDVKIVIDNLNMLSEACSGNDDNLLKFLNNPDTNVNCVNFIFNREGDSCIEELYRMCGSNPRVAEIIMSHSSFDPNIPDVVTLYPKGGDGIKMSILEFLVYMLSDRYRYYGDGYYGDGNGKPTEDELKLLKLLVTHHKTTNYTLNKCLEQNYNDLMNNDLMNTNKNKFDIKAYIQEIRMN